MEIIQDNYNNKCNKCEPDIWPLEVECEKCDSIIEIEKDDCWVGPLGALYWTCPLCEGENMLDKPEGITLTKDNIKFPQHFFKPGGKDLSDEKIEQYINSCITTLRKNKYEDDFGSSYIWSGNTLVYVKRYPGDEEYYVVVTKSYYETHIPFEETDYT